MNTIDTTNTAKGGDQMSQVSMHRGFWFYFKHNGHDISVHGSAWSAKETIYVNNHPVSVKRNFIHFVSEHNFVYDGVDYVVQINVKGLFSKKRSMSVTLLAGGEVVNVEEYAFRPDKQEFKVTRQDMWKVLLGFAGLVAVGYFVGYFIGSYGAKAFQYIFA